MLPAQQAAIVRDLVARARLDREDARAAEDAEVTCDDGPALRSSSVRYTSDQERIEARRRTYRESKQRNGYTPAFKVCRCGRAMSPNPETRMCVRCYRASIEPAHGTYGRYASRKFRCRCVPCRQAATEFHRARRAQMVEWKQDAA